MSGHTIIDTPIDVDGVAEIVGPIMNGRKPAGQVNIKCKIDIGDNWDWVIAEFKRSEIRKKNEKIEKKKRKQEALMKKLADEEEEMRKQEMIALARVPLRYPFVVLLSSLSIFDIVEDFNPSVSTVIGLSVVAVILECGEWKEKLGAKLVSNGTVEWQNLSIACPMDRKKSVLLISVISKTLTTTKTLGGFSIVAETFRKLPRDEYGEGQVLGGVILEKEIKGQIAISCQLSSSDLEDDGTIVSSLFSASIKNKEGNKDVDIHMDDDLSLSSEGSSGLSSLSEKISVASTKSYTSISQLLIAPGRNRHRSEKKKNEDTADFVDDTTKNIDNSSSVLKGSLSSSHFTISRPRMPLPIKIEVLDIQAFELQSVHMLMGNRPEVAITCGGRNSEKSRPTDQINSECRWLNLKWSLILQQGCKLNIVLSSRGVFIGKLVLKDEEVQALPRNHHDLAEIYGSLQGKSGIAGRIFLKVNLSTTEIVVEDKKSSKKIGSLDESGLLGGGSNDIGGALIVQPFEQLTFPVKVEIIAINVFELRQFRFFEKNTPNVKLEVGLNKFRTTPIKFAGEAAEWHHLCWKFMMKEKNNIIIEVCNREYTICRLSISGSKLASIPRDITGICEIVESMQKDSVYLGSLRILLTLSNDESPPASDDEDDAKAKSSSRKSPKSGSPEKKLISNDEDNAKEDDIDDAKSDDSSNSGPSQIAPPAGIMLQSLVDEIAHDSVMDAYVTVLSITIADLDDDVNDFAAKKEPLYVTSYCGPVTETTNEYKGTGLARWENLDFIYSITKAMRLRFSLYAGKKKIGGTSFGFEQLRLSSQNSASTADIFGILNDSEGNIIGKVRIVCRFKIDGRGQMQMSTENHEQKAKDFFRGSYLDNSLSDNGHTIIDAEDKFNEEGRSIVSQEVQSKSSIDVVAHKVELPMRVVLTSISLSELRSVHTFSSNSPYIQMKCGNWDRKTVTMNHAGKNAVWESTDFSFLLIRPDSSFEVLVFSGNKLIGSATIFGKDFVVKSLDSNGNIDMSIELKFGEQDAGDIRMLMSFIPLTSEELEGLNQVADNGFNQSGRERSNSLSTTTSRRYELAPDETVISYESLTSGDVAYVRLKFIAFAAADLRPVHTLGPNSPFIIINYGGQSYSTEVQPRAGASARWIDLKIAFEVNNIDDNVAVEVRSGSSTIGSAVVSIRSEYLISCFLLFPSLFSCHFIQRITRETNRK
jgi:hypothetical protein